MQGIKGSVYAVAMDAMGTLLVAGSPESAIRVSDPRTGAKAFKLRGHTDNIRSDSSRLCSLRRDIKQTRHAQLGYYSFPAGPVMPKTSAQQYARIEHCSCDNLCTVLVRKNLSLP